jgi:hypothetical protein
METGIEWDGKIAKTDLSCLKGKGRFIPGANLRDSFTAQASRSRLRVHALAGERETVETAMYGRGRWGDGGADYG